MLVSRYLVREIRFLERERRVRKFVQRVDVVFDGVFRGVGDEEVVVGEGVVVTSSSLEMLTNSCLGRIMVSLIFLEGLEKKALVEFMVELFEKDDKKNTMSKSESESESGGIMLNVDPVKGRYMLDGITEDGTV
nr:hypothetical protein [Tanacetum cinerariifolium]